jgi:hypothetical protein
MYADNVLVIDTDGIYMYDGRKNYITKLYDLDNLHCREDIEVIREIILNQLFPNGIPEEVLQIRNHSRRRKRNR